mmetsp:Transcript_8815/g.17911  ORF Transcript_8815/g.17911 Transcript_8815/m.17911 type:complete len:194 (+) Transcript_8815:983-1564(+)
MKRTSKNTKKGAVDDDHDDDAPDCLACLGRHRPHTCTLQSRKRQKAAKKLQAESSVFEPSLQSSKQVKKDETSSKEPKASQAVGKADAKPKRKETAGTAADTGVSFQGCNTSTRETSLGHPLTTVGIIVDHSPPVIYVHPTLTTAAAEAAIAAVPPESAQATTADSMTSQRLINLLWDDLLVLPLERTPENDT